ncbi:MAG: hypothetical protein M3131_04375 [Actinomycetota bacterium]|nr:hypothetical protein [Actinomycetota bacterium]
MRIGRRVAAAAVLACTFCVDVAAAAEKAIWGPTTLPGGASAFPTYRALGVDTLQLSLDWPTTAPARPVNPRSPSDPAYLWPAAVDRAVSEAAANGIRVALLVSGSPGWANGGRSPVHAPNATDYATFLTAASRRYPSVRRWMIWGEPNRDDRFQPNSEGSPAGARAYAPILDAAYGALKSVSAANIVIGGMTWTGGTVKPASFLHFMRLPNGRPPRLDWFGHNPFPFRFPNLREENIAGGWRDISDMDLFSTELRRVYGSRARFWLSEFTVLSDKPSREFAHSVSRQGQARWLSASYRIADALPSIAGLGWLSLADEPDRPGSANWGLLTSTGARKPSYEAFRLAPTVRFRPRVRAPARAPRAALSGRGLRVAVRPQVGGRITVELRSRRGRRVARGVGRGTAGRVRGLRLRGRSGLRRGSYELTVRAPRGETVRRPMRLR